MNRIFYLLTAVLLSILIGATISPALDMESAPLPAAQANSGLEPLTDLSDYGAWFQQQTGYTVTADYFGAYALLPVNDTLYIGFGAGRPADVDGSLLAQSDGVTMTAVSSLTEQGFIGMTNVSDTLIIPGVDPCCDDDWSFGNTYIYTPPYDLTKQRNLTDVVHSWGLWADGNVWYTAVSFPLAVGDGGGVFRSDDNAQSWIQIADATDGIGLDRTYDIIGQHDKLFVTWNDVYSDLCGLAVSEDKGDTWLRLNNIATMCRPRLAAFHGNLLALRSDRAAFYEIEADNSIITHTFPGFQVMDWAYNYLAVDAAGYLYTVTDDGRVMRTADLATWETIAATNLDLITIAYWPEKNWLVLSDRGRDAQLWKFQLATNFCFLPLVMHD